MDGGNEPVFEAGSFRPLPRAPPSSSPPRPAPRAHEGSHCDCSIQTPLFVTCPVCLGKGAGGRRPSRVEGAGRAGMGLRRRVRLKHTLGCHRRCFPALWPIGDDGEGVRGGAGCEDRLWGLQAWAAGRCAEAAARRAEGCGAVGGGDRRGLLSHSRGWLPEPRGSGAFSASPRDCSSLGLGLAAHARPAKLP